MFELEKILGDDPHVSGAVVFGQGRFNCGVLVCPKAEWAFDPADEEKLAEYRARIWSAFPYTFFVGVRN